MKEIIYDDNFFMRQQEVSLKSAREMVPFIIDLVHPKSAVDVGCGVGTFLSVFLSLGIEDVLGIDGEYVNTKNLLIPLKCFKPFNLQESIEIDRRFDLVLCLEVAEHLSEDRAETFVKSLVDLGDVILFSAAIPYQGGTNHVNEQWPDYWVKKFEENGYIVIDCIRKRFWENPQVAFWYAQNTLIFVRESSLEKYPSLIEESKNQNVSQLSLVHPQCYRKMYSQMEYVSDPRHIPLKKILSVMPNAIVAAVKWKLGIFK